MAACPATPRTPHVARSNALPPKNTPSATFHTNPVELAIYGTPKQSGSHSKGCRGSAPTEAPHTRWRGLGPGTGRTPATGSASGPAITPEDRFARRWATSARSTIPARPNGRFWPPRAISIIRRHSCACAASRESQARSCGSSSRPSGVTSRPALNEKPAQGPVRLRSRTIRLHATAGPRVEASSVPVWPRCSEHNIHYAKCCIGLWPRSCPRRGNGWASGSALACVLSPRPRMRSRHD